MYWWCLRICVMSCMVHHHKFLGLCCLLQVQTIFKIKSLVLLQFCILIGLLLTYWVWPFRIHSKLVIFIFSPSSPLNCCTYASFWCFCRIRMTSASYHGDMSRDHEMHSNTAPIFFTFSFVTRKENLQHIQEFFPFCLFSLHMHT